MPLHFSQSNDGAWRAQGTKRHYRISLVRDAMRSKYRVFVSLDRERGSGTQAMTNLHETFDEAVAWCEGAERENPPTSAALERKTRA